MEPKVEALSGFGRREVVAGYVLRPRSAEEIAEAFARGERLAVRGAGRSYGDAATHREGLVLDLSAMNRVLALDVREATIEVEGGVTIDTLCRTGLPHGLWPYVVTGTRRPTIGGAVGMNVHGKNALRAGTIGEHLIEFDLVTPDGELRTLRPGDPGFDLVLGSAGTLGVVTRAKLRLRPVSSGLVEVTTRRAAGWRRQYEQFEEFRSRAEYIVASVDLFAQGDETGQGYIQAADYVERIDPSSLTHERQIPDPGPLSEHAWRALRLMMRPSVMRVLNRRFATRTRERSYEQPLTMFNFQLDVYPGWERAYGGGGFIQYQSFVPSVSAPEVFDRQAKTLQAAGIPAYLSVLKAHRADRFPLSPSLDGYSLALDLPTTPATWPAIQRACWAMNDLVLAHGGRFYLAKDSTLRPEDARAYLGSALDDLRALKARWDPRGLLTSDLAERLRLFA